jgi:uncharacterized membrane protein
LPERAGSVFGFQVAFCWRNTAIYGGLLLFGFLYGLARDRDTGWLRWLRRPVKLRTFFLLLLPMAADGVTHMLGVRDMSSNVPMDAWYGFLYTGGGSQVFTANWWLRIATGLLAALGAVWFAYPRINKMMHDSEALRLSYRRIALDSRDRETIEPPMSPVSPI